jgi:hypothetical protein
MVSGVHALHITHVTHAWTDVADIRGSPYTVTVAPGPAFAKTSKCRYLKFTVSIEKLTVKSFRHLLHTSMNRYSC